MLRVSVAPLRYGAGIKGKIGSAMAVGVPVVTTSIGAEGMSLNDGENIFVADSAQQFCDAVVKIYSSEQLWNDASRNGLNFARREWGAQSAWKTLSQILSSLGIIVDAFNTPVELYQRAPSLTPNYSHGALVGPISCDVK